MQPRTTEREDPWKGDPNPCTQASPTSAPVTPHSEGSPWGTWPALRSDSPLLGIKLGLGKGRAGARSCCPSAPPAPGTRRPTGQLWLSGSCFISLKTWSALSLYRSHHTLPVPWTNVPGLLQVTLP